MQAAYRYIKNAGWSPVIISAIIAWVCALSSGFVKDGGWGEPGITEVGLAFVLWALLYLGLLLLLLLIKRFSIIEDPLKILKKGRGRVKKADGKLSFIRLFNLKTIGRMLLILVCWLPMTIALYPGVLFNDTIFQLGQFFGNASYGVFSMHEGASFTDHHPIFITFVFGTIINIGMTITGSSTIGLFGLVVIQAIITAFTFAFSSSYLEQLGIKRGAIFVLIGIYALFPLFPLMANFVVKETFFSWIYVWFFLFLMEFIRTKGASFKKMGTVVAFVLVCLLLVLTKKTGLYLVAITCLVFVVVYRKSILVFLASALLPLATSVLLLPTVIFPLFNVSPGSQVEMLGILYQQTARYVIENPNDVTSEEREAIDALLGFDTIAQRYNPAAIDPLKGYGSLEGVEYWPTQAQLTRYLECYIAQGLRHPDSYVKAIGALDGNWFVNVSYGEVTPSIFEWTTTSNEQAVNWYEDVPHYDRPEEIKPLTKQLEQVASFISKIPILSLLFMPVFYMLVIPLLSLMLIIKGSKRYLGLFVPILVSFLFLLVSPATGAWVEPFRYLMPFIYTTPLLIFFALYIKQTGEKKGVPSQDNIQAKALLEEKREGVFDCVV